MSILIIIIWSNDGNNSIKTIDVPDAINYWAVRVVPLCSSFEMRLWPLFSKRKRLTQKSARDGLRE